MISFVRGEVALVGADQVVIDVGGVGLALLCPSRTLAELRVGQPRQMSTALVVREDSMSLFGFADDDERAVFETLQSVSGIGPRIALAMLGVLTPDEIRTAIAQDDLATLCRTPGVGRKGAARLALELKDRIGVPLRTGAGPRSTQAGGSGWQPQVIAGLMALGWPSKDAAAAVEAVAGESAPAGASGTASALAGANGTAQPSVPELLRAALRHLDRA